MSERETICVVDLNRAGPNGFTVLQLPATHVTSVTLPECSLEQLAQTMVELQRRYRVVSFWMCAPPETFQLLARFYNLPIRRVT